MPLQYPFTAVVGSDSMALALILTTISPEVGGVLVRGEKGTAKSTMVRALAAVLPPIEVVAGDRFSSDPADPGALSPDGPFATDAPVETRPVRLVELPVGATEDRVLGSLHLERALSDGKAEYEPGLLARAHRGILYVDEVNLLHDHLVDLLLDAAAMGRSTVERDGISVAHAARFVLVGTMNPEEGELRPQLLDRFGLTVEVAAPRDPALRVEVVRRRMAYDADPAGFVASYGDAERAFTSRIETAQALLPEVVLDDAALLKIAEICAAFDVDGMRADLVTARAAIAHAAWNGRTRVTRADLRAAALLALPHRRRRNPFDAPGIDEDLLDRILGEDEPEPTPPDDPDVEPVETPAPDSPDVEPVETPALENETHDSAEPQDVSTSSTSGDSAEPQDVSTGPTSGHESDPGDQSGAGDATTVSAGEPFRPRLFSVSGVGAGEQGRRSRAITTSGHRIGARKPGSEGGAVHLIETIRAAAPHQGARRTGGTRLSLRADDLRVAVREGQESNLILFCVDASGSMAARARMQQVKAAVLSLLLDAYRRRDKVGLVTFRGSDGVLALPPTSSVEIAAARLEELPAGGRTPLAEGMLTALESLRVESVRDPNRRPLLVLVTDGRATSGTNAVERSRVVARHLAARGIASLVIDCETGRFRMGLARELAADLGAEYVPLGEVSAEALAGVVRLSTDRHRGGAA
ncbi:VWA domain-containing protein [Nocardioides marmoriginsengisoli]|uniref:Mg-protoporphyrin IX chelatase n=1 Tax=Nocardioides marmoriginsengisoli TaxID=661483 RepID=A0A3N0CBE4_9ACTN|nr:magnesium chelatase subunit D family protein [Nocardioides marmoriginsengisoli]RNL60775.1 VWA domain-containing protein [Nocardioides marmoriginsengisoli]